MREKIAARELTTTEELRDEAGALIRFCDSRGLDTPTATFIMIFAFCIVVVNRGNGMKLKTCMSMMKRTFNLETKLRKAVNK